MLTSGTSASMALQFLTFGVSYYQSGTRSQHNCKYECVLAIPPSDPENRGSKDHSNHYTKRITFAQRCSLRSPENPTDSQNEQIRANPIMIRTTRLRVGQHS